MTNDELTQALNEGILQRNQLNNNLVKLLAQSDDRMRMTNDMVSNIVRTLKSITKEYTSQLDALKECRDAQNQIILEQQRTIERFQEQLRAERARVDVLMDKILLRPNINMNQQ